MLPLRGAQGGPAAVRTHLPVLDLSDLRLGVMDWDLNAARNQYNRGIPGGEFTYRHKHEEIPTRTYPTDRRLIQDLHAGFRRIRQDLISARLMWNSKIDVKGEDLPE